MALEDLVVVENYTALRLLRKVQLSEAMTSIEEWADRTNLNLQQIGLDLFGPSYVYNNDGIQTRVTSLFEDTALLGDNEEVTGSWSFTNTVAFEDIITLQDIANSSGQPRAMAYRATSNQAITTSVLTAISMAAEVYDVTSHPMHDNSTNPTRMTIPSGAGGLYHFVGQVNFAANATGRREVLIYKNGAEVAKSQVPTASAGFATQIQVVFQDSGNAGDYYEMFVFQDSGGNLDVVFGQTKTFFAAMKVW